MLFAGVHKDDANEPGNVARCSPSTEAECRLIKGIGVSNGRH
jgi:hypothetical protein